MAYDSLGYAIGLNVNAPEFDTSQGERAIARQLQQDQIKAKQEEERERKRREMDDKWGNVNVDMSKYYGPIHEEVRQGTQEYLDDITELQAKNPYGWYATKEFKDRKLAFDAFLGSRQMESQMLKTDIDRVSQDKTYNYDVNSELDKAIQSGDPVTYRNALNQYGIKQYTTSDTAPWAYGKQKPLDITAELRKEKPTTYTNKNEALDAGGQYFVTRSGTYFDKTKNMERATEIATDPTSRLGQEIRNQIKIANPNYTDDEVVNAATNKVYNHLLNTAKVATATTIQEPRKDGGLNINVGSGFYTRDGYKYSVTDANAEEAEALAVAGKMMGIDYDIKKVKMIPIRTEKDKLLTDIEIPVDDKGTLLPFRPEQYAEVFNPKTNKYDWFIYGTMKQEVDEDGNLKAKQSKRSFPYEQVKEYIEYLDAPDVVLSTLESGKQSSNPAQKTTKQKQEDQRKRAANAANEFGGVIRK